MRKLLLIYIFTLVPLLSWAQSSSDDLFNRASAAYENGRFELVDSLLANNVDKMKGETLISSYRLLALSSLYQDKSAKATEYVGKLLSVDPYYTPYGDAPRFMDLVEMAKKGKGATITTASQQSETLEEAPVPVTLITEEMIRLSNARTLQELLYTYIPGISMQEGEEANFSMRGLSSYSQENVLIMINGVRLNSYCTNSVAADYRISLRNVKQIEVLRGAASSLYGNVALTAVVNIITKSGSDVDGISLTAGAGTGHTYTANAMFGKHLFDSDIMVWASMHSTRGYRHDIAAGNPKDAYGLTSTDGYLYTNGYRGKPAYDLGLTYKWKHLDFLFNHNYGKRTYAYANLYYPAMYDHDRYDVVDGMTPGRGVGMTNANLRYSNSWHRWSLTADAYGNIEHTRMYNIIGDVVAEPAFVTGLLNWVDPDKYPELYNTTEGVYTTHSWQNYNVGATIKGMYTYDLPRLGHGTLLAGAQYDYFKVAYNDFSVGYQFGKTIYTERNADSHVFSNEHESGMSLFMQLKHYFTPQLIFNGGLRYDNKYRYTGDRKKVLSPRVALIWVPNSKMNYKLTYARSFVDAPYFYRASRNIYFGNENLNPEFLTNIQLSATLNFPSVHLSYEGNIFYNDARDVIMLGEKFYENTGIIKSVGWESILTYEHRGWAVRGNLCLQRFLEMKGADSEGENHCKYDIPNITARINVAKTLWRDLTLMANVSVSGKNTNYLPFYALVAGEPIPDAGKTVTQPACALLDLGAKYRFKQLELDVKAKNILNHKYRLGGDRTPVLQEGRMLLATLTWNIK